MLRGHLGLGSNVQPSNLKVPDPKEVFKHEIRPIGRLGLGLFGRRPWKSNATSIIFNNDPKGIFKTKQV